MIIWTWATLFSLFKGVKAFSSGKVGGRWHIGVVWHSASILSCLLLLSFKKLIFIKTKRTKMKELPKANHSCVSLSVGVQCVFRHIMCTCSIWCLWFDLAFIYYLVANMFDGIFFFFISNQWRSFFQCYFLWGCSNIRCYCGNHFTNKARECAIIQDTWTGIS